MPYDLNAIYLQSIDHFEDLGPSVVMASPGMMQSGLSRELFEDWCIEKRNGTIIAGYCVEGTLAKVHFYVRAIIVEILFVCTTFMWSKNIAILWWSGTHRGRILRSALGFGTQVQLFQ